jgi:hypothetical protein
MAPYTSVVNALLTHNIASEVPGPNAYMIPEQEGWDSYKRGAFLEKADRFPKEKPYEGPGENVEGANRSHPVNTVLSSTDNIPCTSDPTRAPKDTSRPGRKPETVPNVAMLRQQASVSQVARYA